MISAITSFLIATISYCGILSPQVAPPAQPEATHTDLSQDYTKPFGFQDRIALSLGLHSSALFGYGAAIPLALCMYNHKWISASLKFSGIIGTSSLAAAIGARIIAPKFSREVDQWLKNYMEIYSQSRSNLSRVNAIFSGFSNNTALHQKVAEQVNKPLPLIPQEWHNAQKATHNSFKKTRGKMLYYAGLLLPVGISALLFYSLDIPNRLYTVLENTLRSSHANSDLIAELSTLDSGKTPLTRDLKTLNRVIAITSISQTAPSIIAPSGNKSLFDNLPIEVYRYIIHYLDDISILRLQQVSPTCRDIVKRAFTNDHTNLLTSILYNSIIMPDRRTVGKKTCVTLTLNPLSRSILEQEPTKFNQTTRFPENSKLTGEVMLDCLAALGMNVDRAPAETDLIRSRMIKHLINNRRVTELSGAELVAAIPVNLLKGLSLKTSLENVSFTHKDISLLYEKYPKIILPPMFKKLTFNMLHQTQSLGTLDAALQLLHPECNFTTLQIPFDIFSYSLGPTFQRLIHEINSSKDEKKTRNVKIKTLEITNIPARAHQNQPLHVRYTAQRSTSYSLLSETFDKIKLYVHMQNVDYTPNQPYLLKLSIPFGNITQTPSAKIVLCHSSPVFLNDFKVTIPCIYESKHLVENISIWTKIAPSDEFIKQIVETMHTTAFTHPTDIPLNASKLKRVDFYNAEDRELMQHISTQQYPCVCFNSKNADNEPVSISQKFLSTYDKNLKSLEIRTVFALTDVSHYQLPLELFQKAFEDIKNVIIRTNLLPSDEFTKGIRQSIHNGKLENVKIYNTNTDKLIAEIKPI